MNKIIKLGGVEFTENELDFYMLSGNRYILQYRNIYEINKVGEKYTTKLIYKETGALPITKRGRYFMWKKEYVDEYINRQNN